jgi:hypothetical protein
MSRSHQRCNGSPVGTVDDRRGMTRDLKSRENVISVTSALVVEAYTEMVAMRLLLKLVGLVLVLTLGLTPSLALAGTCTAARSPHACCPPKLVPQTSMAMNGPVAPAPCCQFSSGRAAPATESQIQTPTSPGYRPIVTAAPLATLPVPSEVSAGRIRSVLLPPAQSSLCTFLI